MRDRLIEMIQNAVGGCARHWAEVIADHLLENGVIVPSVSIGQTVYSIVGGIIQVFEGKVYEINYGRYGFSYRGTRNGYFTLAFNEEHIGKTVFLTKEEAEKALERSAE